MDVHVTYGTRVVQHLLIRHTLPDIERRLVGQTYACRAGLGTHRCLERAAAPFASPSGRGSREAAVRGGRTAADPIL